MGHENNIDSIRALERQIEEGKGDTIKLKRARNSLLNISTYVPPEILGGIFVRSLVWNGGYSSLGPWDVKRLQKGSYNFLLVCHHWFEVASLTPELWNFWGNTLRDWKKRHPRSGTTPFDLVLNGDKHDPHASFDESLEEAVRGRALQGTIRRVHLTSGDGSTLTPIISSLTPNGEGSQNENIESINWRNGGFVSVDVTNFFARSRLSKLHFLGLSGNFRISSWDRLASQTTLLTTLSLKVNQPSPTTTVSQLFLILASTPNLQGLSLSGAAIPEDADGSTFQVPLPNLKTLSLTREFRLLFGLLRQLILPEMLDEIELTGLKSTVHDVSQTLAPYIQDHFRRDARFQTGLEVSSSFSTSSISISVNVVCSQTTIQAQKLPRAAFAASLASTPPPDVLEQLFIDFIAPLPREHVLFFEDQVGKKLPEELYFMMPNIETLHISDVKSLKGGFLQPNPDGPCANMKLLPSLRSLRLRGAYLDDDDWDCLAKYIAHQTSGGQTISLDVGGYASSPCLEVVEGIVGMVEIFTSDWLYLESGNGD